MDGFRPTQKEDRWWWRLEENGVYTVNSMYKKLEEDVLVEDNLDGLERRVFCNIWKSMAPLKVVAFSWKLMYDRIQTQINLCVRNVLPLGATTSCVLCNVSEESSNHIFLHCEVVKVGLPQINEVVRF